MMNQLQERKEALQLERERLNGNASLCTEDGRRYVHCLALLAMTEMQIEELQDKAKRPLCESDRA